MAPEQGEAVGTGPLTEELLRRLLASATPEAYLAGARLEDRSLAEYAGELLARRGLRRADVIRSSELNPTFAYQIFQGTRRPGRDTAIRLAFGLGCSLLETQRLLRLAGVAELWSRDRRDAIVIYCISNGMDLRGCEDELYRLGERALVGDD